MSPKVMVVEDEAVVALDIVQELESAGYSVVGQVASGEEAILKAGETRPDVVLMDIHVQGSLDGIAALLALAPRFGRPTTSVDQTRIFLTRKELADLTGTTPETAIRVTKNLEREGLLDLTKPGVIKILSLQQLKGVVE